jgi:hypothetical protein
LHENNFLSILSREYHKIYFCPYSDGTPYTKIQEFRGF